MVDIKVPRPKYVLGDPMQVGSSFRIVWGPEDENGVRQIVAHIDSQSPYFDRLWTAIQRARK